MVIAIKLTLRNIFSLRFTVGLNGTPWWSGVEWGLALCGEDSRGSAGGSEIQGGEDVSTLVGDRPPKRDHGIGALC